MDGKMIFVDLLAVMVSMQLCGFVHCENKKPRLTVTSSAFIEGGMIPSKHGAAHENVSPAIAWSGIPETAKTIALICDDPDAPGGDWVHWVIFNIPAAESGLPENVLKQGRLENGAVQGVNDSREIGYDGPMPPSGIHRYYFKVFALDTRIDLPAGSSKKNLLKAMFGHILAEGQLMGTFKKGN